MLEINLLEKYSDKYKLYIRNKFNKSIEKNGETINNTNPELDLKIGDRVKFNSGFNNHIRYESEILGFSNHSGSKGKAYILWDCWWYSIDLKERKFEKITES